MSIVLVGSTSGSCTLQEQAVAGNTVLTLPTTSGTIITTASAGGVSQSMLASGVAGTGPAFSANNNTTQSISTGTFVKVALPFESFDTNNNFDSTTNYRFTPTVAGYYQISGAVYGNATNRLIVSIFKNGSELYRGSDNGGTCYSGMVSGVVYFNGSTDYVELYVQSGNVGTIGFAGATNLNWFTGALVRAA